MLRRSAALVLSAALVAVGLVAAPSAAQAADHPITLDAGAPYFLKAEWDFSGSSSQYLGSATTSIDVTLPAEFTALGPESLNWSISIFSAPILSGTASPTASSFQIPVPSGTFVNVYSIYTLKIESAPGDAFEYLIEVYLRHQNSMSASISVPLTKATAQPLDYGNTGTGWWLTRIYEAAPPGAVRVDWGDTITIQDAPGFWTGGPEGWASTVRGAGLTSADISSSTGYQAGLASGLSVSGDGSTLTVQLPASRPADVNWSTGTYLEVDLIELVQFVYPWTSYTSFGGFNAIFVDLNFHPTDRYSGQDRFVTSSLISQQFDTATRVYVANGRNYPDALSAAPAAAHAGGPLLLVDPNVLPEVIRDELMRLQPAEIVVVGGPSQVSQAVRNEIEGLYAGTQLVEKQGVNRYETSRLVTEYEFGVGATANAYVVTGRNFPDALAASAAAAHFDGPVILIDGSATSIDDDTQATLDSLGVTTVRIAGSNAVVTDAIEADLQDRYGVGNVIRNAGINRYETSIAINNDAFAGAGASEVYLALGTGYADALSGAALAGAVDAPLFTVPGSCVPQGVLDAITSYGATRVVLLGSIKGLTTAVGDLTAC